jgi:hypothetical protein
MRYRPFIFAPDSTNPDGGPLIQIEEPNGGYVGMQSTLPAQAQDPVLYDHKDNPVTIAKPRPGFDLSRVRR